LLTAKDTGNNTATEELTFTVIDLTAPEVLNLTVDGLDITVVTDEPSNLTLYYSLDAINWNSFMDINMSLSHRVTLPLSSGTIYYYFQLSDEYGNSARYPVTGFLALILTYKIHLTEGWNLISLPLNVTSST